ncbi:MAG: aminoglycoside phosphotransferase family protein [Chloroflexi bacterium]|nr:aminoglycoside phosphotransferase family protein [Chloroflexota bacterium]
MVTATTEAPTREWPFSRPELMAGLRRYLAANTLRLRDIQPVPIPSLQPISSFGEAGTRLRAIKVGVTIDGDDQTLALLVKEPPVTARGRVLTAVGQREFGVYRRLAPHLPLLVPGLVAGDEREGWIVLEALAGLRPVAQWTADDYREAILNLVALHDRFYGLSEPLETYAWLARPFDADYAETVEAAAEAVEVLLHERPHLPFAQPRYADMLRRLVAAADAIAAPLRAQTFTLVHGDYWPGNIACSIDGRQIVFDWQLAAIGPAILDLVGCVQATLMHYQPALAADAIITLYRIRHNMLMRPAWDDTSFALLWDHALLWRFMVNWLGKLATMTPEQYARIAEPFNRLWLEPARAAMERRLASC